MLKVLTTVGYGDITPAYPRGQVSTADATPPPNLSSASRFITVTGSVLCWNMLNDSGWFVCGESPRQQGLGYVQSCSRCGSQSTCSSLCACTAASSWRSLSWCSQANTPDERAALAIALICSWPEPASRRRERTAAAGQQCPSCMILVDSGNQSRNMEFPSDQNLTM